MFNSAWTCTHRLITKRRESRERSKHPKTQRVLLIPEVDAASLPKVNTSLPYFPSLDPWGMACKVLHPAMGFKCLGMRSTEKISTHSSQQWQVCKSPLAAESRPIHVNVVCSVFQNGRSRWYCKIQCESAGTILQQGTPAACAGKKSSRDPEKINGKQEDIEQIDTVASSAFGP